MKSKKKFEGYTLDTVEQVVEEAFVKEPEKKRRRKARKSTSGNKS